MRGNKGTVAPGSTLYFYLDTFAGATGASITASGLAVADIEIYKNGGTTQRASDSGYTLLDTDGIDFDGITGVHGFSVDLSDNSDSGFYVAGAHYVVIVSSITVDSQTVNFVAGEFDIGYDGAILNTTIATLASQTSFTLTAGPAEANALVGCPVIIHDIASAVQLAYGIITAYAVTTKTVTLLTAPTFTIAAGDNISIFPPANGHWIGAALPANATIGAVTTVNGLAANVITAASIATDAIGADELAASALTEIVDGVWDEPLTAGTHNVPTSSGRRLRNVQDFGIYDLASVWVDEVSGSSTGTTNGEDATVTNRANDFDNAQTIAASIDLDRIHVQAGNNITLTAALNGYEVWGQLYTIALGGQDIGNSRFVGATISGIGTGTTPEFSDCLIGVATLPPALFFNCSLTDTLVIGSAGDYRFIDCQSGIAGASTPVVDLGAAVGATTVEFRRWSGGLTLNNVHIGDVISIDVVSGGTITINGTGGAVVIRGICNIVDGSGGTVSITETAVINMTKINTEADTALSDIHLDHLLAVDYDPASKPGVATALLNELVEDDGGVSRFTANALEQAPSGGLDAAGVRAAIGMAAADLDAQLAALPTAGENADAVWDETSADHLAAGSTGAALASASGIGSITALEVTYTVNDNGGNPIDGAQVWITTDAAGNSVVWSGVSDGLGIARAIATAAKPFLDPGTYYVWTQKTGYTFSNPATIGVS